MFPSFLEFIPQRDLSVPGMFVDSVPAPPALELAEGDSPDPAPLRISPEGSGESSCAAIIDDWLTENVTIPLDFPPEILSSVLALHSLNRSTLLSTSSVSHLWHGCTNRVLYRVLEGSWHTPAGRLLLQTLDRSPALLSLVRTVNLEFSPACPAWDHVVSPFENVQEAYNVLDLVRRAPNVRRLALRRFNLGRHLGDLKDGKLPFILESVTKVKLECVELATREVILSATPNVEHLELQEAETARNGPFRDPPHWGIPLPRGNVPVLRNLRSLTLTALGSPEELNTVADLLPTGGTTIHSFAITNKYQHPPDLSPILPYLPELDSFTHRTHAYHPSPSLLEYLSSKSCVVRDLHFAPIPSPAFISSLPPTLRLLHLEDPLVDRGWLHNEPFPEDSPATLADWIDAVLEAKRTRLVELKKLRVGHRPWLSEDIEGEGRVALLIVEAKEDGLEVVVEDCGELTGRERWWSTCGNWGSKASL